TRHHFADARAVRHAIGRADGVPRVTRANAVGSWRTAVTDRLRTGLADAIQPLFVHLPIAVLVVQRRTILHLGNDLTLARPPPRSGRIARLRSRLANAHTVRLRRSAVTRRSRARRAHAARLLVHLPVAVVVERRRAIFLRR